MKSQHATIAHMTPQTFASSYQWMLPPVPVLDEEFDETETEEQEAQIFYPLYHAGRSH